MVFHEFEKMNYNELISRRHHKFVVNKYIFLISSVLMQN